MSRWSKFLYILAAVGSLGLAGVASADPITLAEAQALYPQYTNMDLMAGFQNPCVDASGTMVINAFVGDITQFDIAIAMICQAPGYPPFCAGGPVSFNTTDAELIALSVVPGHPDAFALEFIARAGLQNVSITIENTCWPAGCVELIDYAGFELLTVASDGSSWGSIKALF
jgi:hypothetical protein